MATIILNNLYHNGEQVKEIIQNGDIIYVGAHKLVFDVDKDNISFEDTGGSTTITITANEKWTMTKPEWITASQTSGFSTATITLSASATETERTGNIVIACGGKTKTISVVQGQDYSSMYFTIEALSGGTFYVRKAKIGYSVNGGAWETTTGETALSLNQGDEVRFKGTAGGNSLFTGNTLAHNVYGNIESLEYGDDYKGQTTIKNSPSTGAFGFMFSGSTGTRNVDNLILPATTLKGFCYYSLFQRCTSLTTAPELPATALTSNCYAFMFDRCNNLRKAPDLLAPTLSTRSYYYMFNDDVALRYIKCLATNPDTNGGTAYWVQGVTSNVGTFVKKEGVTWPTGNSGIPSGWTVIEE